MRRKPDCHTAGENVKLLGGEMCKGGDVPDFEPSIWYELQGKKQRTNVWKFFARTIGTNWVVFPRINLINRTFNRHMGEPVRQLLLELDIINDSEVIRLTWNVESSLKAPSGKTFIPQHINAHRVWHESRTYQKKFRAIWISVRCLKGVRDARREVPKVTSILCDIHEACLWNFKIYVPLWLWNFCHFGRPKWLGSIPKKVSNETSGRRNYFLPWERRPTTHAKSLEFMTARSRTRVITSAVLCQCSSLHRKLAQHN